MRWPPSAKPLITYSVFLPFRGRKTEEQRVSSIEMPVQNEKRGCADAPLHCRNRRTVCRAVACHNGVGTGAAKIEAGEDVYDTNCQICHGEQLVNTGQTFDLRRLKDNERPRFENSVRNGKNQMPPWKGKLTDEEIDQLWHYIRANAYQK